jgi:H+-transporting ATPase
MSIDQSALTGESLPVTKVKGDACWSGTIVKQGQNLAIVTHTGEKTFLGRAAHLIAITEESGHFQQVITRIGNFIIVITLTMVIIILVVAVVKGQNFLQQLDYALVLTIASIPVGLPTVLSVTMAVGAKQLAAKQVIVKRLTAVEEMAGLRILCSDKTGTLTLNQLSVDDPYLSPGNLNEDLLLASFLASEPGANDAIELCVRTEALAKVPELKGVTLHTANIPNYRCVQFQPFDPVSKLTRAVIHKLDTDEIFCVAKGAPQVILKLCKNSSSEAEQAIVKMARRGFRALGVARSKPLPHKPGEEFSPTQDLVEWQLVGLLSLLDPPRPDSGHTIKQCNKFGLDVKMITGDAVLIAKEVAKRLGMNRNILHPSKLQGDNEAEIIAHCVRADGFAQVVPEDKFRVVELLQKEGHLVGMTGDGVNDAPALKKANVGIAVHGCTDAARSAADIVLLQPGLSTIVDGIITSRQIFQRMRSYAVYRITSTVHFMVFMFFAILCMGWSLPPDLIVLITLLNDAATIVISVDNAKISKKPDKWRLGQMLTLSVVLGLLLTASSFAHWFIANNVFQVERSQLDTILYLQMSSCPHFVIFSTRLAVPFYKNPPSLIFFVAVAGTQVFAMFISIYGVLAAPIGWGWGVSIMCVSIGYFFVLDFVKCQIYRVWSFELTACLWPSKERRAKLARYRALAAKRARFNANVSKVRHVVTMVRVAKNWGDGSHYHNLPEAELAPVPSGHH